jgi:hypothetical protein
MKAAKKNQKKSTPTTARTAEVEKDSKVALLEEELQRLARANELYLHQISQL